MSAPDPPRRPNARRRSAARALAWGLLGLALLVLSTATIGLVRRHRAAAEIERRAAAAEAAARAEEALPPVDDCRSPETDALGLGLTRFATEGEMIAALGDMLLLPDPQTLPEAATFAGGYYNAGMQGSFRQSTIGARFTAPEAAVEMAYFNIRSYDGPVEAHTPVSVRGREGFLFQPPFQEDLHSVMWREDCRWVSVAADLPADRVLAIAAGLRRPGAIPPG